MAPRVHVPDAVERRAGQVVERFGLSDPPVALEDICRAEGLFLCARPFDYVAGVFIRDEIFPVIMVNSREPRVRRRFTIAHELGHYFLAHERTTFTEPGDDLQLEREANRFAGCLLMPAPWLKRHWKTYAGNRENRESVVAGLYGVSPAALRVRLGELGLSRKAGRLKEIWERTP
jgi:Zn-dependent peptidase ImmA (M78 family)